MGYWNTRGLRGSALEDIINMTNEVYKQKNWAIIQKVPTPITPIKIDKKNNHITLAYFDKKSTIDYIGVAQGIAICFDAKETTVKNFPLQNVHQHQVDFMQDFCNQKGVSFFLVYFKSYDKYFFLPFDFFLYYWERAQNGGRKSIPFDCFKNEYEIPLENNYLLNYLKPLNAYLIENLK